MPSTFLFSRLVMPTWKLYPKSGDVSKRPNVLYAREDERSGVSAS